MDNFRYNANSDSSDSNSSDSDDSTHIFLKSGRTVFRSYRRPTSMSSGCDSGFETHSGDCRCNDCLYEINNYLDEKVAKKEKENILKVDKFKIQINKLKDSLKNLQNLPFSLETQKQKTYSNIATIERQYKNIGNLHKSIENINTRLTKIPDQIKQASEELKYKELELENYLNSLNIDDRIKSYTEKEYIDSLSGKNKNITYLCSNGINFISVNDVIEAKKICDNLNSKSKKHNLNDRYTYKKVISV